MNVWLCLEFSGRDICTSLWVTGTLSDCNNNDLRIYLVLMYLDITAAAEHIFPPTWKELVTHCSRHKFPLIPCIDTNAHSILWGKDSSQHGELLENYIFSHSLVIKNVGHLPTFTARGAKTSVDITLLLNLSPDTLASALMPHFQTMDVLSLTYRYRLKLPLSSEPGQGQLATV